MGLKGNLDELPLSDLIEMTSLGSKPARGAVSAVRAPPAGQLAFRDGRVVGATCGPLTAEKAFYAILQLKDGSFDFDPAAELDEGSCNLATESLLMEGMRRLDEVSVLRRSMPAPAVVRLLLTDEHSDDPLEARVLGYLGPGARTVGDIVDGLLVSGDIDEYDALKALARLRERGTVRVEVHPRHLQAPLGPTGLPQPELER
jgi:hypothetical protein